MNEQGSNAATDTEKLPYAAKDQWQPPLPETVEINGITYRREADRFDVLANKINFCQFLAIRTGVTLRQAVWFETGEIMPE